MFDYLGVGGLVFVAAFFGWLTARAGRLRRAWLKWPAVIVSGLVTLLGAAGLGLALVGFSRLNALQPNPVAAVQVAGTPAQLERGERLAQFCALCHSPNEALPLSGRNLGEGGLPMGAFYAPNLTPAHLKDWSDGEIIRAIREGVGRTGRPLAVMPADVLRHLSDADAQALVAFLRSQPAVEPDFPPTQFNVIGAALVGAGMLPFYNQPAITGPVTAPPAGVSPEYGQYLTSILYCQLCHGERLTGGQAGNGPPPGPNLTTRVPNWTAAQFTALFRDGLTPGGTPVDENAGMPWKLLGQSMNDNDLLAMYAYLSALPPEADSAQ